MIPHEDTETHSLIRIGPARGGVLLVYHLPLSVHEAYMAGIGLQAYDTVDGVLIVDIGHD
jgi:hypothetical protein